MPVIANKSKLTHIVVGVVGSLGEDHNAAVEDHN